MRRFNATPPKGPTRFLPTTANQATAGGAAGAAAGTAAAAAASGAAGAAWARGFPRTLNTVPQELQRILTTWPESFWEANWKGFLHFGQLIFMVQRAVSLNGGSVDEAFYQSGDTWQPNYLSALRARAHWIPG